MPKPLSLEVQTRLVFNERVLDLVEDAMAIQTGQGERVGRVPGAGGRARWRGT